MSAPNNNKDEEIERIDKKKMEEMVSLQKRMMQAQKEESSGKPILLSDANFSSEISKHKVMVVDFWAPWCGPCRMVGPIIEQLASEYAGKIAFGKLNVDDNPMVSNMFGVRSIPTILVFSGGKAVDGVIGAVPKAQIEQKFKVYLGEKGSSSSGSIYS